MLLIWSGNIYLALLEEVFNFKRVKDSGVGTTVYNFYNVSENGK